MSHETHVVASTSYMRSTLEPTCRVCSPGRSVFCRRGCNYQNYCSGSMATFHGLLLTVVYVPITPNSEELPYLMTLDICIHPTRDQLINGLN